MTYLKNIDDALGPREERYFGNGYLGVVHSFRDLHVIPNIDGFGFACRGKVTFPEVWSKKGGEQRKPHLTTIDVIELTLVCLSALAQHVLSNADVDGASVEKIEIIAGASPVESELDDIEITGDASYDGELDTVQVLLDIANMKVVVSLKPGRNVGTPTVSTVKLPVTISEIVTHMKPSVASGAVSPLQSQHDKLWPVSSTFAAILQLGQVLLYQLDGVGREKTNTLWMKRTSIQFLPGATVAQGQQPSHVWLENERHYTKSDGHWRRAEICGLLANTKIVCSVTHKLPA